MNICDAVVTAVRGKPYKENGYWFVEAEVDCYGRTSNVTLAFSTEDEAKEDHVGTWVLV